MPLLAELELLLDVRSTNMSLLRSFGFFTWLSALGGPLFATCREPRRGGIFVETTQQKIPLSSVWSDISITKE